MNRIVTDWQLPSFYCPIESLIHPRMDQLEQRAIAWADKFNLYSDETERAWGIATHAADFSCRLNPFGNEELILLFIEWNYWAFAIDDLPNTNLLGAAKSLRIVDAYCRILHSLSAPGSINTSSLPFKDAFDDLVMRTRAKFTPFQFQRLISATYDWLFNAVWESSNADRGVIPTLNDCVATQHSVNGTRFSTTFTEVANQIEIPTDILFSSPVQAIIDLAGFVVSCDNDFFSYIKDQASHEQNIINIVAHHKHCSLKEAISDVLYIRDHAMTLFLRLRERIIENASSEMCRYLESLGHYISGCIQWQNNAPRYVSPRNRYDLPIEGMSFNVTLRNAPIEGSADRLKFPAMTWWRRQLEEFR
jgi:hypothetical protein